MRSAAEPSAFFDIRIRHRDEFEGTTLVVIRAIVWLAETLASPALPSQANASYETVLTGLPEPAPSQVPHT